MRLFRILESLLYLPVTVLQSNSLNSPTLKGNVSLRIYTVYIYIYIYICFSCFRIIIIVNNFKKFNSLQMYEKTSPKLLVMKSRDGVTRCIIRLRSVE